MPKSVIELDVMLAFRHGIRDIHERIEAAPLFSCLMTEAVSPAEYVNALQGLHQFYSEIEPLLLAGIKQYLPDYLYLARLNLLEKDLFSLGVASDSISLRSVAQPPSKAQTLGMLYVVEGSTLGGQIISRHLQGKLGEHMKDVLAFYTLDGNLNTSHWGQLKTCFRENLISQSEIAESIDTSREMFQKLLAISDHFSSPR